MVNGLNVFHICSCEGNVILVQSVYIHSLILLTFVRDMFISCINLYIHVIIHTAYFGEGYVNPLHQLVNTTYFGGRYMYVNLLRQSVYTWYHSYCLILRGMCSSLASISIYIYSLILLTFVWGYLNHVHQSVPLK